jgi:hypothetical protein
VHSWFSRSPARRAMGAHLLEETVCPAALRLVDTPHDW